MLVKILAIICTMAKERSCLITLEGPSHLDIENLDKESKKRVIKYRELRDTYLKQGTSVPSTPEYNYCASDDKLCCFTHSKPVITQFIQILMKTKELLFFKGV